jgi:twitching motility protein PilT
MIDLHLRSILKFSVEQGASDIHIAAEKNVMLRVSGGLVECEHFLDADKMNKIIDNILAESMKEKYRLSGDVDLSYSDDEVGRFRINIHRQKNLPVLSIRYVKSNVMNFEDLNLPSQLVQLAQKQRGIIFITGTTGSGKSTTVASMINYINRNYRKHIVTIEDPIEYEFADDKSFIEQREVGFDTISFDSALVHSLRQDPDVILVGEMRSRESFDCALKAADTGHLVLTTMHTLNATQAIDRILNLYTASEHQAIRHSLANNLAAIISQRLIPGITGDVMVPAVEILNNNSLIQALLIDNRLDKLLQAVENSRNEGMQTFNQSLVDLVKNGLISEEEALIHASNPEALKMNLKGVYLSSDNSIIG